MWLCIYSCIDWFNLFVVQSFFCIISRVNEYLTYLLSQIKKNSWKARGNMFCLHIKHYIWVAICQRNTFLINFVAFKKEYNNNTVWWRWNVLAPMWFYCLKQDFCKIKCPSVFLTVFHWSSTLSVFRCFILFFEDKFYTHTHSLHSSIHPSSSTCWDFYNSLAIPCHFVHVYLFFFLWTVWNKWPRVMYLLCNKVLKRCLKTQFKIVFWVLFVLPHSYFIL